MFWSATFAWDYLNYLIPAFAMLIVFAAFGTNAYVEDHRLGLVLLVLLVYGWAALAFVYLVSFLFRSPATAMVILIIFNIVTGQWSALAAARARSSAFGSLTFLLYLCILYIYISISWLTGR